jgi:hypothetical protein
MNRLLLSFILAMITSAAMADVSAGQVAGNASDILETVTSIVVVILYVAAMGVFVSACMKYRIHRQNPQQIPLSTPVTELVLALVLAALPTVSRMTNEHLFKQEPNLIQSQQTPQGAAGIAPRQIYQQPVYQQPTQPQH